MSDFNPYFLRRTKKILQKSRFVSEREKRTLKTEKGKHHNTTTPIALFWTSATRDDDDDFDDDDTFDDDDDDALVVWSQHATPSRFGVSDCACVC